MSSRPRILFLAWADSTHTHKWAKSMKARGYEIEILSVGGEPIDGVPTTIYPYTGPEVYLTTFFKAMQFIRAHNPDMIHIHAMGGYRLWANTLGSRKRVISVWGSDIVESAQRGVNNWLVGRAVRGANMITATSHNLADHTLRLYPDIAHKLQVIPFGVDIPDRVQEMPPFPPNGPFRVCMLKCDRPLYGAHLAIEAIAILREQGVDIVLTLLYPHHLRNELTGLVEKFKVSDSVRILEPLPHQEVANFIGSQHLLLRPSSADAFGVAVIEAGACGRATIASRVGGLPEVVRDNETGVLIAPNSVSELLRAILSFVERPERCETMGKAARAFVQREYQWSVSVEKMAAVYDQVLGS